ETRGSLFLSAPRVRIFSFFAHPSASLTPKLLLAKGIMRGVLLCTASEPSLALCCAGSLNVLPILPLLDSAITARKFCKNNCISLKLGSNLGSGPSLTPHPLCKSFYCRTRYLVNDTY